MLDIQKNDQDLNMSQEQEIVSLEKKVCANNYKPLNVVLHKASGVHAWDQEGNKYLDMMSAYSAVSHGHNHPELLKAMALQAQTLSITSRAFYTDKLEGFLRKICDMTGLDMVLPMNTGAEAVETAIKSARRWGYQVKKIPQDKAEIIVANDCFHGRTTTIVGFSTDDIARKDFGPFTPGFKHVPFGDAKAVEDAITENTCAVIFEPIQGEAGIIIPPQGWLKEVEAICRKKNVLLILDEIQTGLARTGKLFAYQHEQVNPDGIMLGKALGGGLYPVSAFVAKREVLELITPGSHGSTFGGNPLAAAIGLRSLELIEELHLVQRSAEMGRYFLNELLKINSKAIKEVRGIGLWIGLELDTNVITGRKFAEKLLERGILSKDTHDAVIRLAPPLIIEKSDLDWAILQVKEVINELG